MLATELVAARLRSIPQIIMKHKKNQEPKVWVTLLKLLAGLLVIIGAVGLALWYAKGMDNGAPNRPAGDQWGISKDSPLGTRR